MSYGEFLNILFCMYLFTIPFIKHFLNFFSWVVNWFLYIHTFHISFKIPKLNCQFILSIFHTVDESINISNFFLNLSHFHRKVWELGITRVSSWEFTSSFWLAFGASSEESLRFILSFHIKWYHISPAWIFLLTSKIWNFAHLFANTQRIWKLRLIVFERWLWLRFRFDLNTLNQVWSGMT